MPLGSEDHGVREVERGLPDRRAGLEQQLRALSLVIFRLRIVDRIVEQDRVQHCLAVRDSILHLLQVAQQGGDVRPVVVMPLRFCMARAQHCLHVGIDTFAHGRQAGTTRLAEQQNFRPRFE